MIRLQICWRLQRKQKNWERSFHLARWFYLRWRVGKRYEVNKIILFYECLQLQTSFYHIPYRHGRGALQLVTQGFKYDGFWALNAPVIMQKAFMDLIHHIILMQVMKLQEGRGSCVFPGGQEYQVLTSYAEKINFIKVVNIKFNLIQGGFKQGLREGRGSVKFAEVRQHNLCNFTNSSTQNVNREPFTRAVLKMTGLMDKGP